MAQQIVRNTGVNYSLYYNVLNYFKTIMKNHPSIQSVTYGDVDTIDDKQYTEYPLGNVLITDSRFETSTTTFTVQLTIADLQLLSRIVDLASRRGAFQAGELSQVGDSFNKLSGFLAYVESVQTKDAEVADATTATEASAPAA